MKVIFLNNCKCNLQTNEKIFRCDVNEVCLCFLFQGIFREDDLEHFDEDFKSNFQKRQADIFSEEGWGEEDK